MWNIFVRLGIVLSTALLGKQVLEHFWPSEIHPTRLYRPEQIARYLGTSLDAVHELIKAGQLNAKWVEGRPLVLGMSVLHFLGTRE